MVLTWQAFIATLPHEMLDESGCVKCYSNVRIVSPSTDAVTSATRIVRKSSQYGNLHVCLGDGGGDPTKHTLTMTPVSTLGNVTVAVLPLSHNVPKIGDFVPQRPRTKDAGPQGVRAWDVLVAKVSTGEGTVTHMYCFEPYAVHVRCVDAS